jgi:tetratricopeptide (TPR) repeat protein
MKVGVGVALAALAWTTLATCSPAQMADQRAQYLNARGEYYCQTRQYDLAIADQTEAIRLRPNFPEAHVDRAGCYMGKHDYKAALADYDAAIRLAPKRSGYYPVRAQIRIWLGDPNGAFADYDQAIRLSPDFQQYVFERGLILVGMGRYHDAAEQFVVSNRAFPTSPRQVLWLHIARMRAHEPDDAEFQAGVKRWSPAEWPAPLTGVFLDKITLDDANAKAMASPDGPYDGACDFNLFMGEYELIEDRPDQARTFFGPGTAVCGSTKYFNDLRLLVDWAEYNRLAPSARGTGPLW